MGKDIHENGKKKRILIVSNSTWNIYNFRLNLVKHLIKEGHEVIVVAPPDRFMHFLKNLPGLTFLPLHYLKRDSRNLVSNIFSLLELHDIYRKHRPDTVLQFTIKPNILGSLAARFLGLPSISVITGLGYTFLDGTLLRIVTKFLYRISLQKCKHVIFENPDDQQLFLDLGLVTKSQAIVVNGCGVDVDYFSPMQSERQDGMFVFTFIGRLLHDKGILEYIKAAEIIKDKYPNVSFWVVGERDEGNPSSVTLSELKHWVADKVVTYLGAMDDVRPTIAQSDCIVLPSYREGLPKILLEAMAMGKPILTTDVPGCREVVDGTENGMLCQPKNVTDLAAKMESFLGFSHLELCDMGQAGRNLVETHFHERYVVGQYFEALEVGCEEKEFRNELLAV